MDHRRLDPGSTYSNSLGHRQHWTTPLIILIADGVAWSDFLCYKSFLSRS